MKLIALLFTKVYSPVEYLILLILTHIVLRVFTPTMFILALLIAVVSVVSCVYIRDKYNLN